MRGQRMAGLLVAVLAAGVGEAQAQFLITRGGAGLGYGGWNRTQPGSRGTIYQPVLRQPGMSRFATRSSQSPIDLSYVAGGGSYRTGAGLQAPILDGSDRFRGQDPYLAALSRSASLASRERAPMPDRGTIAGRLAATRSPPSGVRPSRYDLTRYMSRGERSAVRLYAARLAEERELDAAALAALRRSERPDPERGPTSLSAASAKEDVAAPADRNPRASSPEASSKRGTAGPSAGKPKVDGEPLMAPVPVESSSERRPASAPAPRHPLDDFAAPAPAPAIIRKPDQTPRKLAPAPRPAEPGSAASPPARSTSLKPRTDGPLVPRTGKEGPGRLGSLPAVPPAEEEPEMKPIPVIPD